MPLRKLLENAKENELDAPIYIWARQQVIRDWHSANATDHSENAAIAIAGVSVLPNGNVRFSASQVKPEQCAAIIGALRELCGELERFRADHVPRIVAATPPPPCNVYPMTTNRRAASG